MNASSSNKSLSRWWRLLMAMLIAAGFALVAGNVGAEELKARLSYHWGPTHHSAIYADKYAAEVNKRAAGKLHVDVFPSAQLFGIRQIMGALSAGSVEIGGVVGIVSLPPINKNYNLENFAGMFDSFEQFRRFFRETPEGRKVWEDILNKTGTVLLAYDPVGPFMSFSVKSDLSTVASIRGLRARALSGSERPRWKALGADIVSLPTEEVYTSLQNGLIDTFNTVPPAIKAYSWWEYVKYGQLPYQSFADAFIMANAKWFNGLPADVKKILLEVGDQISKESTDSTMADSSETLKEFEARGGKVTVVKGAALAEFEKLNDEVVEPAMAELVDQDVLRAAKRFVKSK